MMAEETLKNLSNEELQNYVKALYQQLNALNLNNTFKRLDYLFMLINSKYPFKHEVLEKASKEIEVIMFNTDGEDK
jgi:hypothetical protein